MPRTLAQRIAADIGPRLMTKYFPAASPPLEAGHPDVMAELVAEALMEIGNQVPIIIQQDVTLSAAVDYAIAVSLDGLRYLKILEVIDRSLGVLVKERSVDFSEGSPRQGVGWFYEDGRLQFSNAAPSTSAVRLKLAVVPTELEISTHPTLMRGATMYGVISGLQRIRTQAMRDQEFRLQGAPDVAGTIAQMDATIRATKRDAADLLGDMHAVLL